MTWVKGDATPAEAENDLRRALRLAWSLPYADFYATADLKTAKRMGGILWLVAWVIVVLLLPVAPPTEHVGDVGWVFVAVTLVATPDRIVHLDETGKADIGAGLALLPDSIFWIA